jgi:hypothetical protein
MAMKKPDDIYYLKHRCPRCSALLLTDRELVWCSLLDGNSFVACEFGHDQDISVLHLTEFRISLAPLNDEQARPTT